MLEEIWSHALAWLFVLRRDTCDGSGSHVIRVYLDGKEIAASVEKKQRERGASIMGNEVYSY